MKRTRGELGAGPRLTRGPVSEIGPAEVMVVGPAETMVTPAGPRAMEFPELFCIMIEAAPSKVTVFLAA